jgi:secreted trypsin-like serine protease
MKTFIGDSGGPLTLVYNSKLIQVGIVSFGSQSSCQRGYPTVFTRVTNFLDWIETNSGVAVQ